MFVLILFNSLTDSTKVQFTGSTFRFFLEGSGVVDLLELDVDEAGETSLDCRRAVAVIAAGTTGATDILVSSAKNGKTLFKSFRLKFIQSQ